MLFVESPAAGSAWQAYDHRHPGRLVVCEPFGHELSATNAVAVVGREDNQRIGCKPRVLERIQNPPKLRIYHFYVTVVAPYVVSPYLIRPRALASYLCEMLGEHLWLFHVILEIRRKRGHLVLDRRIGERSLVMLVGRDPVTAVVRLQKPYGKKEWLLARPVLEERLCRL